MKLTKKQALNYGLMSLALITAACNDAVNSGNNNKQENTLEDGLVYSNEEVGEREDKTGAFRTNCLESHEANDDPL